MSGAWEIPAPEVLLATLTREVVSTRWAAGYRALRLPPTGATTIKSGAPFDYGRNMACDDVLKHGFTWLFFLDDDVVPPPDAFARLAAHGKDIVSGLYYRRASPIVPVAMTLDDKGESRWVTEWSPPDSLVEVDYVGAGCLLIHRRVLERLPRPWFVWEIGRGDLPAPHLSEDFSFCRRAKQAGFSVYLDTSVRCEHIGLGQSGADGFRPSAP